MPFTAPYATWKSPITAQLISSGALALGLTAIDGENIYWLESRPNEEGRNVLMCRDVQGSVTELTPAPYNIRTRVHEYGGGAYAVKNDVVYFAHFSDQCIYRQSGNQPPVPLTPEGPWRYADLQIDTVRNRLICVREDHSQAGKEAVNELVSINLADGAISVIVSGADFYSSPRLSPDGKQLAWISWNHPDMPWDATELWLADFSADGSLAQPIKITGDNDESITQPEWSPDNILYFVSDKTGWWNIYRYAQQQIQSVCPMQAEFAYPHWQFCMSQFGFISASEIACAYNQSGTWQLGKIPIASGKLETIPTDFTDIQYLRASSGRVVFHAAAPAQAPAITILNTNNTISTIRTSVELPFDKKYLSTPQNMSYVSKGKRSAHGFFYPPCNPDFVAPENSLPPLIVISHGGPTAAASTALKLPIQFWTSRGFAVLDVNYAGSTGYGRDYRRSLYGLWGIADVEDCIAGAQYLAQQKRVDGERLIIRGSSAGGYTTLCALTFHHVFKAGASYYGISDVAALAQDTHKFESRYEARLIGGRSAALYRERSPIHHAERLSCPVIFFQGLEDKVVSPNQSERMADALKKRGIPVAYVPFEGEQHGFRQAKNIQRALEAELYFYAKVFGFELAEKIEPVPIVNL